MSEPSDYLGLDYLALQLAGNAPRTAADHAQFRRWRTHDPAFQRLRSALEAIYGTPEITLAEARGIAHRALEETDG